LIFFVEVGERMAPIGPARVFGIRFNDDIHQDHCGPDASNSIVDVTDVCVGQATFKGGKYYINGDEKILSSPPPPNVNSGVTAILPLGNKKKAGRGSRRPGDDSDEGYGINTFVPAGMFGLNGCGEMTGIHWVEESGILQGPIMLTNTVQVGTVRNAVIDYWKTHTQSSPHPENGPLLPVVAETYDAYLNDILDDTADYHQAALDAIDNAVAGPPLQGNYGAGTGTTCYSWKGGIGTSSRIVKLNDATTCKVGVLVQANQGTWNELTILGVPVGTVVRLKPKYFPDDPISECGVAPSRPRKKHKRKSSIIVVIATDAALLPYQLKRLAKRAALGIARTGTCSRDESGELCIAFSTANQATFNGHAPPSTTPDLTMLDNDVISPCLFTAAIEATEEAIINALLAADDLTGNGSTGCSIRNATDPETLQKIMTDYQRM
jgi:D-aminopeptidase